jgi:hypothetical protein
LGPYTGRWAGQQIENVVFRTMGNGVQIRNLRRLCGRNQVSDLMLVHKKTTSQAGVGHHFRKSFRFHLEIVPRGVGESRGPRAAPHTYGNTTHGGPIVRAWSFIALCGGRANPSPSPGIAYVKLTHNLRVPYAQLARSVRGRRAAQLLTQTLTHNLHATRLRLRTGRGRVAYARAYA